MLEYNRRSANVNGYPSYEKYSRYLYRGITGCWMVAENSDQMNNNRGVLRTVATSWTTGELPTLEGLQWQFQSSSKFRAVTGTWRDDSAIKCKGTNKVTLTLVPKP